MPRPRVGWVIAHPHELARLRAPLPEVDVALLRTFLLDLPRAAGARASAETTRRKLPNAELVPFVWHLVSHGPDDPLPGRGARRPAGEPHAFGQLRDTQQVERAWEATVQSARAAGAARLALHTPASVAPGAVGRTRLSRHWARAREAGFSSLWEPAGPWSASAAYDAAGPDVPVLWPAPDPSASPELVPPGAWLLVRCVRGNLSPARRDWLEELAEDHVLLFHGDRAVSHLRAFCR